MRTDGKLVFIDMIRQVNEAANNIKQLKADLKERGSGSGDLTCTTSSDPTCGADTKVELELLLKEADSKPPVISPPPPPVTASPQPPPPHLPEELPNCDNTVTSTVKMDDEIDETNEPVPPRLLPPSKSIATICSSSASSSSSSTPIVSTTTSSSTPPPVALSSTSGGDEPNQDPTTTSSGDWQEAEVSSQHEGGPVEEGVQTPAQRGPDGAQQSGQVNSTDSELSAAETLHQDDAGEGETPALTTSSTSDAAATSAIVFEEMPSTWPSVGELNARFRRLIAAHQRKWQQDIIQRQQQELLEQMASTVAAARSAAAAAAAATATATGTKDDITSCSSTTTTAATAPEQSDTTPHTSSTPSLEKAAGRQSHHPINRWSRREEADFYRVASTFGVERDRRTKEFIWTTFRILARLEKKEDAFLTEYFDAFCFMCRRVAGRTKPDELPPNDVGVIPVSNERALRCLARIDLLSKIREDILWHPKLTQRLKLCRLSLGMPSWWQNGPHDKDLLIGAAKHGLVRTDFHVMHDPKLCFRDFMRKKQQDILAHTTSTTTVAAADASKARLRDVSSSSTTAAAASTSGTSKRQAKTLEEILEENIGGDMAGPAAAAAADGPTSFTCGSTETGATAAGSSSNEPVVAELLARAVGALHWPKDKVIYQHLENVCYCVENSKWPEFANAVGGVAVPAGGRAGGGGLGVGSTVNQDQSACTAAGADAATATGGPSASTPVLTSPPPPPAAAAASGGGISSNFLEALTAARGLGGSRTSDSDSTQTPTVGPSPPVAARSANAAVAAAAAGHSISDLLRTSRVSAQSLAVEDPMSSAAATETGIRMVLQQQQAAATAAQKKKRGRKPKAAAVAAALSIANAAAAGSDTTPSNSSDSLFGSSTAAEDLVAVAAAGQNHDHQRLIAQILLAQQREQMEALEAQESQNAMRNLAAVHAQMLAKMALPGLALAQNAATLNNPLVSLALQQLSGAAAAAGGGGTATTGTGSSSTGGGIDPAQFLSAAAAAAAAASSSAAAVDTSALSAAASLGILPLLMNQAATPSAATAASLLSNPAAAAALLSNPAAAAALLSGAAAAGASAAASSASSFSPFAASQNLASAAFLQAHLMNQGAGVIDPATIAALAAAAAASSQQQQQISDLEAAAAAAAAFMEKPQEEAEDLSVRPSTSTSTSRSHDFDLAPPILHKAAAVATSLSSSTGGGGGGGDGGRESNLSTEITSSTSILEPNESGTSTTSDYSQDFSLSRDIAVSARDFALSRDMVAAAAASKSSTDFSVSSHDILAAAASSRDFFPLFSRDYVTVTTSSTTSRQTSSRDTNTSTSRDHALNSHVSSINGLTSSAFDSASSVFPSGAEPSFWAELAAARSRVNEHYAAAAAAAASNEGRQQRSLQSRTTDHSGSGGDGLRSSFHSQGARMFERESPHQLPDSTRHVEEEEEDDEEDTTALEDKPDDVDTTKTALDRLDRIQLCSQQQQQQYVSRPSSLPNVTSGGPRASSN